MPQDDLSDPFIVFSLSLKHARKCFASTIASGRTHTLSLSLSLSLSYSMRQAYTLTHVAFSSALTTAKEGTDSTKMLLQVSRSIAEKNQMLKTLNINSVQ